MQASPSHEQMGAYIRQAAIELLEGAAPAGYDARQAGWPGAATDCASCKPDPRELMSRAEIFRLLD